MIPYSNESSTHINKKTPRSKYNKLTKEQKLEIIKEWCRTRLPTVSLASKFGDMWGMKLSNRGIADIITYWKENGKIRGYSQNEPIHSSINDELQQIQQFCIHNQLSLSKEDFQSCIKYIQQKDQLLIEDYEMLWLNTLCQRYSDGLQFSAHDYSTDITSILSQYNLSSIFTLDFHTFSKSHHSLPVTLWTLLSASPSLLPILYHVSQSTSFTTQFATVLEKLDNEVEGTCLLFFCDCIPFIKDLSYQDGNQVVTFCDSTPSISLRSLHLEVLPRVVASSILPTYRGVSSILRILFHLLIPSQSPLDHHSLQPLQLELQKLPLYSFWNIGQGSSLCYYSIDDVFQSTHPSIMAICEQFKQFAGDDMNRHLKQDEEIEFAGLNALIFKIHQIKCNMDSFMENPQSRQGNQLSFFMELYGRLITNLPDVTVEDFTQMDSFYTKMTSQNYGNFATGWRKKI